MDDPLLNGDTKFRLLFERTADAILLLDTSTNLFVDYNQAALDMLRCTREEMRSLHPSVLSPPTQPDGRPSFEKANEMIATAVRQGSHRFEWIHCSPHREDFPVEVLLTPVQLGQTPLLITVWRDITERKQAEAALRQAQKLESLGVLAGGVAHDFNNLLLVMISNLELARSEVGEPDKLISRLDKMEQTVLRAANLTRQMLAYAGKGRFVMQALDFGQLVQEMAELLSVSLPKSVSLSLCCPDNLPPVEGDVAQLQQVVMNLVTNAAEAMGDQPGRLELRVGVAQLGTEDVERRFKGQGLAPGGFLTLEVTDSGCGMDEKTLSQIFDPFFTTKAQGRGLGLAALQGILRGHHAGIEIHSIRGRGSTFRLFFPACTQGAASAHSLSAPVPALKAKGTILLVDDEPEVRATTAEVLQALGFTVLVAGDGIQAIACFLAHRHEVSLVLLDLTMPGMDGHEVLHAIRALAPEARVVLCSGYTRHEVVQRLEGENLAGFIQKPFQLEELKAVIHQALQASPRGSRRARIRAPR